MLLDVAFDIDSLESWSRAAVEDMKQYIHFQLIVALCDTRLPSAKHVAISITKQLSRAFP